MNDSRLECPSDRCEPVVVTPELFAWRGGGIVLFGERAEDRWVVARGWLRGDACTDVRRWSFAAPERFIGQVRRLVTDATADAGAARLAATRAAEWCGAAV